jgi:hypothetical protein
MLGDSLMFGEGQEERLARHLLGWYEEVKVFRFPDGEYERFKQVVVLACFKRQKYQPPKKEALDAITIYVDESNLSILPMGEGIPHSTRSTSKTLRLHTGYWASSYSWECSPIGTPAYEQRPMSVRLGCLPLPCR